MVHTSTKVIPKQTKKRAFPSVTCSICLSTFASRPKMMKHIKEEHNKKSDESNSPKRKVSRTVGEYIGKEDNFQDPNARIEEEENEVDNYADDTTITATAQTVSEIGKKLSSDCSKVSDWMRSN